MQLYRLGDRGPAVAEIRAKLAALGRLPTDGADLEGAFFDPACDRAIRAFQQERGLRVDGVVGPETYRALDEARWRLGDRVLSYTVGHPFVGDDVVELQQRLLEMGFDPGRVDGIFGPRTEAALRELQRNVGLPPDGTCGPRTLKVLRGLARTVVGGSPEQLREEERLLRTGPALAGKLVVLDPGHGDGDRGATGNGLEEAAVVEDVAAKLEGRLGTVGVLVFPTRGPDSLPTDEQRAAFANDAEADLFVSLHCEASTSPSCNGVATYYYGHATRRRPTGSAVGRRLASLIQRELVARTDLLDCRTHPKTWELLRLTRMPAVRLDLGYLTNPGDAARLGLAEFRDTVAEAIAVAIQRLYLPPDLDAPTGQLRLPTPAVR